MLNTFSHRSKVAQLKQAMIEGVSPDDLKAITAALIEKAKEGNVQATKLLFQYVFGKPTVGVGPEDRFPPSGVSAPQPAPTIRPDLGDGLTAEVLRELAKSGQGEKRPQASSGTQGTLPHRNQTVQTGRANPQQSSI